MGDKTLTIACVPNKQFYIVQLYRFFFFFKLWSNNTMDTIGPFNLPITSKMKSQSLEFQSTVM